MFLKGLSKANANWGYLDSGFNNYIAVVKIMIIESYISQSLKSYILRRSLARVKVNRLTLV